MELTKVLGIVVITIVVIGFEVNGPIVDGLVKSVGV